MRLGEIIACVSLVLTPSAASVAESDGATPAPPATETPSAQAPATTTPTSTTSGEDEGEDAAPRPAPKKTAKKGRRPVEKETDGTQAPNRFEADTVIKSQYQLGGEQLEVDPD